MIYAYTENGHHVQRTTNIRPAAEWWIRFDPDTHIYEDSDGLRYKSCTSFITCMESRPFQPVRQSIECAANTTGRYADMDDPAAIRMMWEATATVGSELHAALESYLDGSWQPSKHRRLRPLVDQFADWRMMSRGDYVKPERILWSRRLLLAGMADIVSMDDSDGSILIDDIKTFQEWTSDREQHAAHQLGLLAILAEECLHRPAKVGGVVLFENYYHLRGKARLSFKPCSDKREELRPALYAREYRARQRGEDMALKLSGGVLNRPKRICIHGVPGIGKSTFAAAFPKPAFVDTEGSTANMDVQRFDAPHDWNGLMRLLNEIQAEATVPFDTLVLDTVDWAEKMAMATIAKSKSKARFADIAYGAGDKALAELFKDALDALEAIQAKHGTHVCLIAHTWITRVDPPDMLEGYHRYGTKLSKWVAPIVSEWCDALLFANSKSERVKTDAGKGKGVGDRTERVLYTTDTDSHEAKNRFDLPPELPFERDRLGDLVKYLLNGGKKKEKGE